MPRLTQALPLTLMLISACDEPREPLPTTYETEHLLIGTEDQTLCAGDLIAFENVIRRAEEDLGFDLDRQVTVSIWSDDAWRPGDYCDTGTYGCYHGSDSSIFTRMSTVTHELVHAVIDEPLPVFLEEGLVDVYGGDPSRFGSTAPIDNLELSGREIDGTTARHFVMWLRETWGAAKLGELARLGKHAVRRFDDVYGMSIEAAQAKYFAEAPYGYPSMDACTGAPLDPADLAGFEGWQATVDLDCETSPDTRVYGIGRMVERTLVIPEPGYYSVSTDADGIMLYRCTPGPIVDAIRDEDPTYEDVPPNEANSLMGDFALYHGGGILDLYFGAGKHTVGLFLMGYGSGSASLAIWPTLGPKPVPGAP